MATDVAARGIDIASLSLVVHVEIPRDAEALQHRSGRTGRAGKKGTAVLIVPYPRRRRVEMMLRGARIEAEWMDVPGPEQIRAQDHERLIATLTQPIEPSEAESELAGRLLATMGPEELAIALVRAHASRLPEPEELIDMSARTKPDGQARPVHHREGFDDTVWFRMDIGRRHNADPRWLLPLLCRRGHVTRNEIGAIRITPNETFFQIPRALEAKFRAAVARTGNPGSEDESGITIDLSPETPRDAARENRPRTDRGNRGNDSGPRPGGRPPFKGKPGGHPKPHRKGPRQG